MSDTKQHWGEQHERTVTWHDPRPSTRAGLAMSGLDYFNSMMAGDLPPSPISQTMNMTMVEAEPGRVVFACEPGDWAFNPLGSIHGGLACTLLDTVCGCAMHTVLPVGRGYTSIEIKVNYLKPIMPDSGPLQATGKLVRAGSRVGFTEGEIRDKNGDLVATATSTLLIFDVPSSK